MSTRARSLNGHKMKGSKLAVSRVSPLEAPGLWGKSLGLMGVSQVPVGSRRGSRQVRKTQTPGSGRFWDRSGTFAHSAHIETTTKGVTGMTVRVNGSA
jgi:hypothetical protein